MTETSLLNGREMDAIPGFVSKDISWTEMDKIIEMKLKQFKALESSIPFNVNSKPIDVVKLFVKYYFVTIMHFVFTSLSIDLTALYLFLFEHSGEPNDLNKAIKYGERRVDFTLPSHPEYSKRSDRLATAYRLRYRCTGDPEDIERALEYSRRAIGAASKGIILSAYFSHLQDAYQDRFGYSGDLDDIDDAIKYAQLAIRGVSPCKDTLLPLSTSKLGDAYRARFFHSGSVSDIEKAIEYAQIAVNSSTNDDLVHSQCLVALGDAYQVHYRRFGCTETIEKAFNLIGKALRSTPKGDPHRCARLKILGDAYYEHYFEVGKGDGIQYAIKYIKSAIECASASDHFHFHTLLHSLGRAISIQFIWAGGNLEDINRAIAYFTIAIELTPPSHTNLALYSSYMAQSLINRFGITGDLVDLDSAIKYGHIAVESSPKGHAELPRRFSALGLAYWYRSDQLGSLEDIENSIKYTHSAVNAASDQDQQLYGYISRLSLAYFARYKRSADLSDLDNAIEYTHQSIKCGSTRNSMNLVTNYSNLGELYQSRFEHSGNTDDIDKAIEYAQSAVDSTLETAPYFCDFVKNLGFCYLIRFKILGDLDDIDKAVKYGHAAVASVPDNHPDLPSYLEGLSNVYRHRFQRLKESDDIENSISFAYRSIDSTPNGHVDLPLRFKALGEARAARFEYSHDEEDLSGSISAFWRGAQASGNPHRRFENAKVAAYLASGQGEKNQECLDYFAHSVGLLTQVADLHQTVDDRHAKIGQESDFIASAAAVALRFCRPDLALEWLEQGRCLVWNQLNQLRAPIDDLRLAHPTLSQRFLAVTNELETLGSRAETADNLTAASEITHRHVQLAKEYEEILQTIREFPNFHNFLRPPLASDILSSLPPNGIVVLITINDERCDAIALVHASAEPVHIPLGLTMKTLKTMQIVVESRIQSRERTRDGDGETSRAMHTSVPHSLGLKDLLKKLWEDVSFPILSALDIRLPSDPTERGRLWWCATGPLSFLPLHAAGIYGDGYQPGLCVSDFLVSSYTPTVRSLSDKFKASVPSTRQFTNVALFTQSKGLPGAARETSSVKDALVSASVGSTVLQDEEATIEAVKASMESHNWVHFACHGVQDPTEPLKSRLLLSNGGLELRQIMQLRIPNPELALLSACHTSKGDAKLSEEVVHIAAGMLAVGYRSVVGTMWRISDRYGEEFAKAFYNYLLETRMSDGVLDCAQSSHALDQATKVVRQMVGDEEEGLLIWLPYVHFGY